MNYVIYALKEGLFSQHERLVECGLGGRSADDVLGVDAVDHIGRRFAGERHHLTALLRQRTFGSGGHANRLLLLRLGIFGLGFQHLLASHFTVHQLLIWDNKLELESQLLTDKRKIKLN